MKKGFLIVTFLLSSSVFYAQHYTKEKIEIPFKLSPNGHIMIKASVNGVPGNFVFGLQLWYWVSWALSLVAS